MNTKKIRKAFTLVELLVVIAILAILGTVGVVGYTAFINKANQSADQQEMNQINEYLKAEEVEDSDLTFSDAVKIAYGNGMDLIARDDDYAYVWNKTNKQVEYVKKTETLNDNYEAMNVCDDITDLNDALSDGGVVYLEGSFDAGETTNKVFNVEKDTVIVGDSSNLVVAANEKDKSGISQYASNLSPVFIAEENNVTLTLCGVNVNGSTNTNSIVAVNANNVTVNIYDCTFTGGQYLVNVRNYGAPGKTYRNSANKNDADNANKDKAVPESYYHSQSAQDAVCNVNIKNSKFNGTTSVINWKYVGGSLTVEDSLLAMSGTGESALICNEGNGVKMNISNSTLQTVSNQNEFVSTQYGAHDTEVTITDCKISGPGIWCIQTDNDLSKDQAGTNNKITVDSNSVAGGISISN